MPNLDAMAKFAVAITSSGNARTTTVRAFAPEEFGKLSAPGVHGYADRIEVFQGTRLGSGEHSYEERGAR